MTNKKEDDFKKQQKETFKKIQDQRKDLQKLMKDTPIIGFYSGKGGVGKTTLAANFAAYLADNDYRVGLIDADIDCPDIPRTFNVKGRLEQSPDHKLLPREASGVKIVSTALISTSEEPFILRGPMKHSALTQLITHTKWGELDYLVIDLPPGTSDVPLSLLQLLPQLNMVLITTPQLSSLKNMEKSHKMSSDLKARILGVIENMTGNAFGENDSVKKYCDENNLDLLGKVPLSEHVSKSGDKQELFILTDEGFYDLYSEISDKIIKKLQSKPLK